MKTKTHTPIWGQVMTDLIERRLAWLIGIASILGMGVLYYRMGGHELPSGLEEVRQLYHARIPYGLRVWVWRACDFFRTPYPYAIALIVALEIRFPARRGQRVLSAGFWQDFVWFLGDHALHAGLLLAYGELIRRFYEQYLSFMTVHAAAAWPAPLRFAVLFLLFDFLQWFHHWLRHKVPALWHFHAVHHSQPEMNLWTAKRMHPVDYLVRKPITFLPLYMFQADLFSAALVVYFVDIFPLFYHANTNVKLGPLEHILVTPRFHRVHHSRQAVHRDKNFGAYLSLWDRLFGTLVMPGPVPVLTGIDDPEFPVERRAGPSLLVNYVKQMVYPFGRLLRANPKSEYRNSKQIQRPEILMTET